MKALKMFVIKQTIVCKIFSITTIKFASVPGQRHVCAFFFMPLSLTFCPFALAAPGGGVGVASGGT